MRLMAILVIVVAFIVGVATSFVIRAPSAQSQAVHSIQARVVAPIVKQFPRPEGTSCFGVGVSTINERSLDLSDFDVKPQVVIRDDKGDIVAKSTLSEGKVSNDTNLFAWVYPMGRQACVWTFTVDDLPERPFYEISIGRQAPRVLSNVEMKSTENPIIDYSYDSR